MSRLALEALERSLTAAKAMADSLGVEFGEQHRYGAAGHMKAMSLRLGDESQLVEQLLKSARLAGSEAP